MTPRKTPGAPALVTRVGGEASRPWRLFGDATGKPRPSTGSDMPNLGGGSRRVHADDGTEYWSARDLMPLMGYPEWREFRPAIERAIASAEAQGETVSTLFGVITEKTAGRPRENFHLSRFACWGPPAV